MTQHFPVTGFYKKKKKKKNHAVMETKFPCHMAARVLIIFFWSQQVYCAKFMFCHTFTGMHYLFTKRSKAPPNSVNHIFPFPIFIALTTRYFRGFLHTDQITLLTDIGCDDQPQKKPKTELKQAGERVVGGWHIKTPTRCALQKGRELEDKQHWIKRTDAS